MNNAPVAVEISAVTPEDNTAGLDIILEATDADGDELTFNVESNPAKGNVIINGNVATYTPSANKTGRDTFTFYANDGKVSSATVTATIDITPVPDAPSLSGSTTASVDEGGSLSFSATLTDVDLDNEGDSHSYTLSGNPVWVSINPDTGELTGTPVEANIGTTEGLIITVTDQGSLSATHTLSITVNDVPYAPSSATASITTNEDTASEGETPLVVDADTNDTHTFAITSTTLPAMGTASVVDNQLVYMPSANVHGMDSFSFSATDQSGNSVEGTASVTILPVNDAPSLSGSTTASVDEGGSLSFSATLTDVDEGDSHSYTLSGNPAWVSINPDTGELTGTPVEANIGTTEGLIITVTDQGSLSATHTLSITVNDVPYAPSSATASITTNEDTASEGETPLVVDADTNDTHTYAITSTTLPAKGIASVVDNQLVYMPHADLNGMDSFSFSATDQSGNSVEGTASVTILPVNDAPSLSGSTTASVDEGGSLSFSATLTDVDEGDSHSYTLSGNPVWVSINPDTGELTGTPVEANIGTTEGLIITVTDQGTLSATHTLSITVNDVQHAPSSATATITTNEDTASEGKTPLVVDADSNDTHTYAITSTALPAMGTASVVDNQLVYMPSANVHGMDSFSFSATDQSGNSVEGTASVTILPVNDAPSLSGSATASVDEGGSLSFSATLTDVDEGDSHSYTLSGNPVWVSINPDTGELTGTPVEANIGTTEGLIITVTDQGTLSATHTLSITVNDVQHAPQIINTPAASVDTEAVYSFTPEVTDADSTDMHTFSISNQPANWSSFDPATGTLTGTPPGDAGGPYSGVEITVTDNTEMSTTIGPFTILVNDVTAPGSVTQLTAENGESQVALNWVNPVETDFAGVVVRRAVSPATPTGPDDDSADLIDSSGISTTPGGSASMVDSTPINGITYNYAVYAQDGAGNASFSGVLTAGTPVAIPPGDVVDLKVIGGDGQLTLSWANPSDADFAGVTLVRREGADPNGPNDPLAVSVNTSALNTTPDATVILTDTGLANDGPAYHYAAFSYDAIGNYAGGVLISATPSVPPGEVTLLSSKKGFAEVKMDWTNPVDSDFSHVLMLRREGQYPAGAMDPLATVVDTTTANVAPGGAVTGFVDDNGLTNTITYFYKLFTVDTLGSVSTGTAFEETPWWPDYVWTFESGSLGFTCFDGPDSDYTCGWSNTSTKAASGSRSIMSNGLNSFSDQLWGPSVTFSDRSTINFDVWSDIPSAFGGLGIWVWDTVQGKKVKVGGFSDATAGVWQNHTIPLGVMASNTSAQRVDLNLVTNSYANWVYMYLDNIRMSYINPTNTLANYTYNSWWKDASRFGSDGSNTTFSTTEYMQTGKTSTGTYELRSYASFTVTSGAPNRAYQGSLTLTLYSYTSDDPSETVCVYDVHTPLDDMLYIRGTSRLDPAIFDDLGTGVELGCLEVTAADVGTVITIPISGKMLEQDLLPKMSPTASSEYTLGLRLVSVNMGTEGTEMVRFDNNGNVTASEIQFSYTIYSEY